MALFRNPSSSSSRHSSSAREERRLNWAVAGILPALMLVLVGVTVVRAVLEHGKSDGTELHARAEQSLANGRFEEARIAALRLARQPEHAQTGALLEAKALQGLGREKDCQVILDRLAPADRPGHAPAHVMAAVLALSQQPPAFAVAQAHLDSALRAEPANREAHELCARLAGGRKDWRAVIKHVDLAQHERADLMLLKATALQASGLEKDAVLLGRKAETRLRSMPAAMDTTNLGMRYSLAISLNMQRRYHEAASFLETACGGAPSRQDRLAMADVYLAWSRHLREQAGTDKMKVVELLEKGIKIAPENQELMAAFVAACDEAMGDDAESARYARRVLQGEGVASSFLHYYLGIREWSHGSKATARDHFQLARDLNPQFTAVTNNLAMSIAAVSDDPQELEKALAMMDPLLKGDPENPYFLDTRSQIYVRLGRHREAARDLEVALPKAQDKPRMHGALNGLYQMLGMNLLSSEHRALAGENP